MSVEYVIINARLIYDAQTGLCLESDSSAYTVGCNAGTSQYWVQYFVGGGAAGLGTCHGSAACTVSSSSVMNRLSWLGW